MKAARQAECTGLDVPTRHSDTTRPFGTLVTAAIAGTGMYPSLVKSVLIDGSPLDPSQYTTVSDTAINVVAPRVSGEFLPVVVQTSQGNSNDTVTIEISIVDFCNL